MISGSRIAVVPTERNPPGSALSAASATGSALSRQHAIEPDGAFVADDRDLKPPGVILRRIC